MATDIADVYIPSRRRRLLSLIGIIVALIAWFLLVEPVAALLLDTPNQEQYGLTIRGALAAVLVLAFTLRRSWRANGFHGGPKLRYWPALWPFWIIAIPLLAQSATSRSLLQHCQSLALAFLVAFDEEAIFRGAIVRVLMPSGPRAAAVGSAFLFGAFHLTGIALGFDWRVMLLWAASAVPAGITFAAVRMASSSIWPALVAHGFYNYSVSIAYGDLGPGTLYSEGWAIVCITETLVMLGWSCWLLFRLPKIGTQIEVSARE